MPEDGTALEPIQSVAGAVPDPEGRGSLRLPDLDAMDIDTLRMTLAETQAKNADLESNIGRQNRIQGEKLSALEQRLHQQELDRQREREEMEEARRQVSRLGMNPMDAVKADLEDLRKQLANERRQQQQALVQQQEQAQMQDLLRKAQAEGYDLEEIDTSSFYNALVSIDVLDRKKQAREIADLKAILAKQQEETVQTVAAVSGRQRVMTGSPSAVLPGNMSAEERDIRERLKNARKGRRGEEVIAIKREAHALGIDLS